MAKGCERTRVLLGATPPGLSIGDVQQAMLETAGVEGIHDLHLWTVTSGFVSLSAHVKAEPAHDYDDVLRN